MIREKSEKERLYEQLDGAIIDMVNYNKLAGQSPVIDANIRHKKEQIERLKARIAEIEEEEREAGTCRNANTAAQTSFG